MVCRDRERLPRASVGRASQVVHTHTLALQPRRDDDPEPPTRLKQCWFAGVHTDVGRGYKDHAPGDIADITFAWMVDQCDGILAFNKDRVQKMLQKGDFEFVPGRAAEMEREDRESKAKHWGLGYLHDSMTVPFVLVLDGSRTRTPGQYPFPAHHVVYKSNSSRSPSEGSFVTDSRIVTNITPKEKSWYWRFWTTVAGVIGFQVEDLAKLAPVWTYEVIHPSVRVRMIRDATYDPPALQGFKLRYDDHSKHWTWVKQWHGPNGELREKRLHEERIENSSFSLRKDSSKDRKEIVEALESGVGQEVPLPPRQTTSWFSFW